MPVGTLVRVAVAAVALTLARTPAALVPQSSASPHLRPGFGADGSGRSWLPSDPAVSRSGTVAPAPGPAALSIPLAPASEPAALSVPLAPASGLVVPVSGLAVAPLVPLRVTWPFRSVTVGSAGSGGVELAGAAGQRVVSVLPGQVLFAGWWEGRGIVRVALPGDRVLTYEPLAPLVATGQTVRLGQIVGRLQPGYAGCLVATCLHWVLQDPRGEASDPLVLLRRPHARLLPWNGLPR